MERDSLGWHPVVNHHYTVSGRSGLIITLKWWFAGILNPALSCYLCRVTSCNPINRRMAYAVGPNQCKATNDVGIGPSCCRDVTTLWCQDRTMYGVGIGGFWDVGIASSCHVTSRSRAVPVMSAYFQFHLWLTDIDNIQNTYLFCRQWAQPAVGIH